MSLIGSFTRPAAGGADLTPHFVNGPWGSSSGAWFSANVGVWVKFRVNRARPATGLWVFNIAPSGNAKSAMYSSDGTTLTQLALSASTPLAGANAGQQIAFGAAVTLVPFVDYMAFLTVDNGTATFLRFSLVASTIVLNAGLAYSLTSVFTTPPPTQLISGLAGSSSGYAPVLAVY